MSGHTLEPVEASIRCHIPMDYLERHGADTVAAMRDYAEDRWTLIERLRAARKTQAELLEALDELHSKAVVGTDEERYAALNKAWAAIYDARGEQP